MITFAEGAGKIMAMEMVADQKAWVAVKLEDVGAPVATICEAWLAAANSAMMISIEWKKCATAPPDWADLESAAWANKAKGWEGNATRGTYKSPVEYEHQYPDALTFVENGFLVDDEHGK